MEKEHMAKTDKVVKDLPSAFKAYGGKRKFAEAFLLNHTGPHALRSWFGPGGIPRGDHLGLCLGLQRRGYTPTPELFGMDSWEKLPGVSANTWHQLPAE
jgi:hypothetical protein